MSKVIDGVLQDWGDRLLPEKVHGRKPRNIRGGRGTPQKKPAEPSSLGLRRRLALTVRKAPEVVVKVSGGGRNLAVIKAHLGYISRHGKLELEDENGALARGRDEVKDVLDAWARSHTGIPEVGERARQAFNIVLSMPPGTSRPGVRAAAKAFAAAEFGLNHQYVFTAHDDEAHPHVHLVVKAVGRDGVRLNPRKADLQRWRELFAGALHEQGIVANATPRRARGVGSRAPAQGLLHMRARGPNTRAPTSSPRAPLLSPVVARAYRSTQQALAASSEVADQRLARELERFLAETSPTVERERKPDGPTRER